MPMRAEDFLSGVGPTAPAKAKMRAEDFLADVESPLAPVVPEGPETGFVDKAANLFTGKLNTEFPDAPDVAEAITERQPLVIEEMPDGAATVANLISKLRNRKDIPKLPASFLFASDTAQKVGILRETYPDAKFSQDKFGNPLIEIHGQPRAYVQKPGIQGRDIAEIGAQAAMYMGGMGLASKLPLAGKLLKTGNVFQKALVAGPTMGATSIGMDAAAMAGGSDQGINLPRAGAAAVLGGGAELLSPIIGKALSLISRNPGLVTESGTFTIKGERVMREAGIDPAAVSAEMATYFRDLSKRAVDPVHAARAAQSGTLPVPVPETLGSTSLSPSQQMLESMARKGAYGQSAEDVMRLAESRQQEALRANIPAIQAEVSGRPAPIISEAGEGGQLAQQALVEAKDRAAQAVKAAYKDAEGKTALITPDGAASLGTRMEAAAAPYLNVTPRAENALKDYTKRITANQNSTSGVVVKDIFDWRSVTSKLMRNTSDRQEAAAMSTMLKTFDDGVQDVVKNHLMAGSDDAARSWLRAIAIKRGAVKRYEAKDLISDLVETEQAGGRGARLAVEPESAANYILGGADIGFVSKAGLGRELIRMRDRLGAGSEAWGALREEAFLRFARKAEGATEGSARLFSGINMRKGWVDAWKKNPAIMRTLFDGKQKNLIDNFTDVAARVTGKVKGGDNPSGTALAMANALQNLSTGMLLGPQGQAVLGRLLRPIYDIVQSGSIQRSALNPVPQITIPGGVSGAVAAGTVAPPLLPSQDIQYPRAQR